MTDPGAARGNQTYTPRRVCRCSDGEAVHDLNSRGVRTACSHEDAAGKCGCVRFEPAEEWAETLFDQRDAAIAAVQRVRALLDAKVALALGGGSGQVMVTAVLAALDGEVSDGPGPQG